jgi:hypothetical protein
MSVVYHRGCFPVEADFCAYPIKERPARNSSENAKVGFEMRSATKSSAFLPIRWNSLFGHQQEAHSSINTPLSVP